MNSIQQNKKKTKNEYLIHAILFHIVLFVIIYIASNRTLDETWYSVILRSFLFASISYPIALLAYYQYEIYLPKKRRNILRHNNLKPLLENGFVINDEQICLQGEVNNYFTRIFWLSSAKLKKQRYAGQKYELYIDIFFLEDIRLRKEVKSAEGLLWHIGFLRSIMATTKNNLPTNIEIEDECNRMISLLKENSFSPVSIEDWEKIYLPDIERIKDEDEKAKIKKEFRFLGLDIKILKRNKTS